MLIGSIRRILHDATSIRVCNSDPNRPSYVAMDADEGIVWVLDAELVLGVRHLSHVRRQRCSDQPDVSFNHLDHIIHLSVPYLFGNAKREPFGRVERNMRR